MSLVFGKTFIVLCGGSKGITTRTIKASSVVFRGLGTRRWGLAPMPGRFALFLFLRESKRLGYSGIALILRATDW